MAQEAQVLRFYALWCSFSIQTPSESGIAAGHVLTLLNHQPVGVTYIGLHWTLVVRRQAAWDVWETIPEGFWTFLPENAKMPSYLKSSLLHYLSWNEVFFWDITNPPLPNFRPPGFTFGKNGGKIHGVYRFLQGDMEKERGIPVQMLNDREKVNRPNSQVGMMLWDAGGVERWTVGWEEEKMESFVIRAWEEPNSQEMGFGDFLEGTCYLLKMRLDENGFWVDYCGTWSKELCGRWPEGGGLFRDPSGCPQVSEFSSKTSIRIPDDIPAGSRWEWDSRGPGPGGLDTYDSGIGRSIDSIVCFCEMSLCFQDGTTFHISYMMCFSVCFPGGVRRCFQPVAWSPKEEIRSGNFVTGRFHRVCHMSDGRIHL